MAKFYCEYVGGMCADIFQIEVEATTYKEAVEIAQKLKKRNMLRVWKDIKTKKVITDAENILYEMDCKNTDTITIKEGLNQITRYTRKEIEESISSNNAIKKYRATKALEGLLD